MNKVTFKFKETSKYMSSKVEKHQKSIIKINQKWTRIVYTTEEDNSLRTTK